MLRTVAFLGLALAANAQIFHYLHPLAAAPAREAGPEPCPSAPARPEGVDGCNWIPIQNSRGCILDYECEPKGPEPCPATPMQPDDSHRCKWTAIKNAKGCIIDFECEPRRPFRMPIHAAPMAHYGYPYGYHMMDLVAPPLAAPMEAAPAIPLTTAGVAPSARLAAPAMHAVAAPAHGGFDYGYWQRYFQAALARGMGQARHQGYGGFQGIQGGLQGIQGGLQGFQGQGQQGFQGFQGQGQQGFQGFQGQNTFQGQGQNSYKPAIPTGKETAVVDISGGVPLTTGIQTRGAGTPRKAVKKN